MPKSDAQTRADRHYRLRKLFEQPGQRLRTMDIAAKLGVSEDTAKRDIDELSRNGRLPLRKEGQYWMLAEDARLERLHVHLMARYKFWTIVDRSSPFRVPISIVVSGSLLAKIVFIVMLFCRTG